jgi:outer membrane lipoprotein SlyB
MKRLLLAAVAALTLSGCIFDDEWYDDCYTCDDGYEDEWFDTPQNSGVLDVRPR